MTKKKDTPFQISQEENEQVESIVQGYRQRAQTLRETADRQQVETALADINALPEAAQMALLAALTKESTSEAAVILLAIHQFGSLKAVRKEAKRALIRLEGARVYPYWQPPTGQALPVIELTPADLESARFWQGLVTDSFEAGEVQLMLSWELGPDYKRARIMGFLLDFWGDGVKDFFTEVSSKRHIEDRIAQLRAMTKDLNLIPCSLARGRHLIEDALAINKKHGTRPHRDYRLNESLIRHMVLEAVENEEDGEDEDDIDSISIAPGMKPPGVVMNFIDALFASSYNRAYDLLSSDSTLRDGLSRAEWVARCQAWEEAAEPENFTPGFCVESKQQSSGLWLPNLFGGKRQETERKKIEASWSLELNDTPLTEGLKALPTPTAVYPETKRHWFWATCILTQDEGEWRIQDIIDEGANARLLTVDELQKRIDRQIKEAQEITRKHLPTGPDADRHFLTIVENIQRALHYRDILISKLPLDRHLYEEAATDATVMGDFERALVYLEPLARNFAEGRAKALRQLAGGQIGLAEVYYNEGNEERGEHFEAMAEATLLESLALEDHYLTHLSLAELLTRKDLASEEDEDKALDEAVAHLRHALTLVTDANIQAEIEHKLAEIAGEREQDDEAILHYRRMAELQPDNVDPWMHLGDTYRNIDNFEEAEASYRRALELNPHLVDAYDGLASVYTANDEKTRAIELLEDGIRNNPDSAAIHALAAVTLASNGQYQRAKALLEEAERLDPKWVMLPVYRTLVDTHKPEPSLPAGSGQRGQRFGKHKGKKHRKR
jgi:tetratricopeptide (TPR) repeat protein